MPRPLVVLLLAAVASLVGPLDARAQGAAPDPDLEIAHGHFVRGSAFYQQSRYRDAIAEFEAAKAAKPLPDLDYNIARCYEQMGSLQAAIDHYDAFIASSKSTGPEMLETRAHVEVLRRRLAEEGAAKPAPPAAGVAPTDGSASPPPSASPAASESGSPLFRHHLLPIAVGGVAVVTAAVGAILVGAVVPRYNALARGGSMMCEPNCPESTWRGLQAQAYTGDALLAVGGALAVADVVLWVYDLKIRKPAAVASSTPAAFWITPSGNGIAAGGTF